MRTGHGDDWLIHHHQLEQKELPRHYNPDIDKADQTGPQPEEMAEY